MRTGSPSRVAIFSLVAFAVAAWSAPVDGDDQMTVGRFIVGLAKTKNLSASDAQGAATSLAEVGVQLPHLSFDKPLTEGDVVLISRAAGLKVSSSDPDRPFSTEQADRFFLTFAAQLGSAEGDTSTRSHDPDHGGPGTVRPGFDPFTKGKKKGTPKEPE